MIIVILFLFNNKLQGVAKKSRSKSIKPSNTSDGETDEAPQQPSGMQAPNCPLRTYSIRCCNTSAALLFILAGPLQIPVDLLQKFASSLPNQAGSLQKFAGPLPYLAGPLPNLAGPLPNLAGSLQISAGPH